MINIYKHGTYLRRKLSSQDKSMLFIMTIKFHNLDLQDTKENRFKIEPMSWIHNDIGNMWHAALRYDI